MRNLNYIIEPVGNFKMVDANLARDITRDACAAIQVKYNMSPDEYKQFLKDMWKYQSDMVCDIYAGSSRNKNIRSRVHSLMKKYQRTYFKDLEGIELLYAEIGRQLLFRFAMSDLSPEMLYYENFVPNTAKILEQDIKNMKAKQENRKKYINESMLSENVGYPEDNLIDFRTHEFTYDDKFYIAMQETVYDYYKNIGCVPETASYVAPFKLYTPMWMCKQISAMTHCEDYNSDDFVTYEEFSKRIDDIMDKDNDDFEERKDLFVGATFVAWAQMLTKSYKGLSEEYLIDNIKVFFPRILDWLKFTPDMEFTDDTKYELRKRIEEL